jgi:chitinase
VRARDNGGNVGPVSNAVSVAFQASSDTTPPSAPTNLTARDFGDFCGSNVLDWTGSTDDTDPPSAIRYEVFRGGLLWHVTPGGVTEAFLYTFPGGTNTWTVVAFDQAGNRSAPSNSATVTVVADPDLC